MSSLVGWQPAIILMVAVFVPIAVIDYRLLQDLRDVAAEPAEAAG